MAYKDTYYWKWLNWRKKAVYKLNVHIDNLLIDYGIFVYQ